MNQSWFTQKLEVRTRQGIFEVEIEKSSFNAFVSATTITQMHDAPAIGDGRVSTSDLHADVICFISFTLQKIASVLTGLPRPSTQTTHAIIHVHSCGRACTCHDLLHTTLRWRMTFYKSCSACRCFHAHFEGLVGLVTLHWWGEALLCSVTDTSSRSIPDRSHNSMPVWHCCMVSVLTAWFPSSRFSKLNLIQRSFTVHHIVLWAALKHWRMTRNKDVVESLPVYDCTLDSTSYSRTGQLRSLLGKSFCTQSCRQLVSCRRSNGCKQKQVTASSRGGLFSISWLKKAASQSMKGARWNNCFPFTQKRKLSSSIGSQSRRKGENTESFLPLGIHSST